MQPGHERLQEFSRSLCSAHGYPSALSAVTQEISRCLPADNALVWLYEEARQELTCETSLAPPASRVPAASLCPQHVPLLQQVLLQGAPRLVESIADPFPLAGIQVRSALLAPLCNPKGAFGLLEAVASSEHRFTPGDLALLEQLAQMAGPALLSWRAHDAGEIAMFRAVTRLTLLFDISQSFHSTIQIDELLPVLTNRTANVLEAEGCRLWLVEQGGPVCRSVFGDFREDLLGARAQDASALVAEVFETNTLCHGTPPDARLAGYAAQLSGGEVRSLLAAPVRDENTLVGVLEVVNKQDGGFSADDADLLEEVAAQAGNSIRNAQRHEAEKKVKELQALLSTSREITASLDLDRVLQIIVNQAASLLPADRCALALFSDGRFKINAVAGETAIDWNDDRVRRWNDLVGWAGQSSAPLYVSEQDGRIDADRVETRDKLRAHFDDAGMRSLYALPLRDEVGPVGVIVLESATPEFLSPSQTDLLHIFGAQATVAIRNAQLYREVPLIGLLEPLAVRRRAFHALPRSKRARWLAVGAAVLLSLTLIPWKVRVEGNAYVLPARSAPVTAEVAGIVDEVLVREGDRVSEGAVVATLRPEDHLLKLQDARTRRDIVTRELQQAQATAETARVQIRRVNLEQIRREIEFHENSLERTRVRTPIAGVVVTPNLESGRGRYLERGAVFCETAVLNPALIDVAVFEDDIGLVEVGQEAWLKANAFPARKFIGRVERISPQATVAEGERVFVVTAEIQNPDDSLRAGMLGKSKLLTASRSIGYAMVRGPAQWAQKALWQWLP